MDDRQQGRHVAPLDREEFDWLYDVGRYQGCLQCGCYCLVVLAFLLWIFNCGLAEER